VGPESAWPEARSLLFKMPAGLRDVGSRLQVAARGFGAGRVGGHVTRPWGPLAGLGNLQAAVLGWVGSIDCCATGECASQQFGLFP